MRLLVQPELNKPTLVDASERYRPEKCQSEFRNYENDLNPMRDVIKETYRKMHTYQTVEFVRKQHEKWLKFNHFEAPVMEVLEKLNDLVDESDPDIDLPNIVHAFQTAEKIREIHPDKDWLQLTGLIHDMGKVLAFYDEPQWAVVGDTFPVGCAPQDSIVYADWSFQDNPDIRDERYNSLNGMYKEGCGLRNVLMSWGHDEYLYQVLKHNNSTLPEVAHDIIRFHSFYPWHTGGDYRNLMSKEDEWTLEWVKEFNKFDLYTKSNTLPNVNSLKPYYQGLIDKYLPGNLKF